MAGALAAREDRERVRSRGSGAWWPRKCRSPRGPEMPRPDSEPDVAWPGLAREAGASEPTKCKAVGGPQGIPALPLPPCHPSLSVSLCPCLCLCPSCGQAASCRDSAGEMQAGRGAEACSPSGPRAPACCSLNCYLIHISCLQNRLEWGVQARTEAGGQEPGRPALPRAHRAAGTSQWWSPSTLLLAAPSPGDRKG